MVLIYFSLTNLFVSPLYSPHLEYFCYPFYYIYCSCFISKSYYELPKINMQFTKLEGNGTGLNEAAQAAKKEFGRCL